MEDVSIELGPRLFLKLSTPQSQKDELRAEAGEGKYHSQERVNQQGKTTRIGRPVVQLVQSTRAAQGKEASASLRLFSTLGLFHLLWSQSLAAVSCGD